MADNTLQTGADTIATDDVATLNGGASSGVKVQRVKNAYGDDGTSRDVSDSFPMPTRQVCATATVTTAAGSVTSASVLAANTSRRGAIFFNDSAATLYLLLGSGTASATNHSVQLAPQGGYYEMPFGYTGVVAGVWSTGTGTLRVTEFT